MYVPLIIRVSKLDFALNQNFTIVDPEVSPELDFGKMGEGKEFHLKKDFKATELGINLMITSQCVITEAVILVIETGCFLFLVSLISVCAVRWRMIIIYYYCYAEEDKRTAKKSDSSVCAAY